MKRRALERHLRDHGAYLLGEGGRHTRWRGPTGELTAVPRHNEIDGRLVRAICRQLGIPAPRNPN